MTLLRAQSLATVYGSASILTDVSFEINAREIVALLGPNGAGKSTALRAAGGLLSYYDGRITDGSVHYEEKNITGLNADQLYARGIVAAPEGRRVFRRMTVRENLEMGSRNGHQKQKLRDSIDEVFELFPRLRERSSKLAGNLSTGEQQMLALGRALMAEPKLLLADEPSTGLSPDMVDTIMDKLGRIRESGVSILFAEQNVAVALDVADRAYVFSSGRVALKGTTAELKASEEIQRVFFGKP